MPIASEMPASFDAGIGPEDDPLAAAATSLVADAEAHDVLLVVAVRPQASDYRVVAADGGNGALRAAVSVMIASENSRVWADVDHREMTTRPVTSLPEVVRAAAEGAGVSTVHISTVRAAQQVGAVVMWFGDAERAVDAGARQHALDLLDAAAERYLELAADSAEQAAAAAASRPDPSVSADAGGAMLEIGSDDPVLDSLTGLASKARFGRAIEEFEGEEGTLLLIDLDHFTAINDEHGTEVGDRILQEIAVRLSGVCRKSDLLARLDADTFAVILDGADRHTGLQISKRLLTAIGEPLPPELGPESITATVAFTHEFGLVDMEELFEAADDAVASGKRSGRGRIVIAS